MNQTALTLFGSLIQRHFGLGSSGLKINLVLPSNKNKVLLHNIIHSFTYSSDQRCLGRSLLVSWFNQSLNLFSNWVSSEYGSTLIAPSAVWCNSGLRFTGKVSVPIQIYLLEKFPLSARYYEKDWIIGKFLIKACKYDLWSQGRLPPLLGDLNQSVIPSLKRGGQLKVNTKWNLIQR